MNKETETKSFWRAYFSIFLPSRKKIEGQSSYTCAGFWNIFDRYFSFRAVKVISHLKIKESIVLPTRFTYQNEVCRRREERRGGMIATRVLSCVFVQATVQAKVYMFRNTHVFIRTRIRIPWLRYTTRKIEKYLFEG